MDSLMSEDAENLATSASKMFDPKVIWYYYTDEAKELTSCALAVLSLPSSEASVERSFSQQAIVHRKHRNRLSQTQVESEMIIKLNLDSSSSFRSSSQPSIQRIEFNDDDDLEFIPLFQSTAVRDHNATIDDDCKKDIYDNNEIEETKDNIECNLPLSSVEDKSCGEKRNAERNEDNFLSEKRRKVSERINYIVPLEEYKNLAAFVKSFVEDHKYFQPIRWNAKTLTQLQHSLSQWPEYIKDTDDVVCRQINLYIKNHYLDEAEILACNESNVVDATFVT